MPCAAPTWCLATCNAPPPNRSPSQGGGGWGPGSRTGSQGCGRAGWGMLPWGRTHFPPRHLLLLLDVVQGCAAPYLPRTDGREQKVAGRGAGAVQFATPRSSALQQHATQPHPTAGSMLRLVAGSVPHGHGLQQRASCALRQAMHCSRERPMARNIPQQTACHAVLCPQLPGPLPGPQMPLTPPVHLSVMFRASQSPPALRAAYV